ncbi:hypothetical protein [Paraburkholderia sp. GAS333]
MSKSSSELAGTLGINAVLLIPEIWKLLLFDGPLSARKPARKSGAEMRHERPTLVQPAVLTTETTYSPASPIVSNPAKAGLFAGYASFFRENNHSSLYIFHL